MHDDAFLDRFSAGRIEPRDFDHRAHLRAAWCALQRHPFLEACIAMREGLGLVARNAGKPGLYHETITIAFMALVDERSAGTTAWPGLLDRHPELLDRGLLGRYYRPDTLASARARARFILPDLHARDDPPTDTSQQKSA